MQYNANNPEEYIQQLEDDWRKECVSKIRTMILQIAPELTEGIEYKMLSYHWGEKGIFHLNAQKNYVSLYVGDISKIDRSQELLSAFDLGKGCIRIRKSIDLDNTSLETFIEAAVSHWKSGGESNC